VTLGRLPSMLNWISNIEQRKRQLTDPSSIRMVDALIVHMRAEFDHDVSAAMATMTVDGHSRHWGAGPVLGALPRKIANSERGHLYQEMVRMSGEYAFKFTEMTDERFYVGPDGICSEGLLSNVVDASLCRGRGVAGPGSGLSEVPVWRGISPAAREDRVAPECPSGPASKCAGVAGELSVDHVAAAR
jgi:hypothetical protein